MSRFHLICLLFIAAQGWGQKQVQKWVAHADQQVIALDYIEALKYYQQALELEPTSIDLQWKIAQTNAQFKDYKTAARFYLKVFEQDPDGDRYPWAQLQYALMLKQQALYKEALAQFKEAKRFFSEDKTTYGYLKANQEVLACSWVLKQLKYVDNNLQNQLQAHPLNTIDAEFAHAFVDEQIIYSALKSDSIGADEELIFSKNYSINLYRYEGSRDASEVFIDNQRLNYEYGNLSVAPDSSFALCSECQRRADQLSCRVVRLLPNTTSWVLDSLYEISPTQSPYQSMPCLFEMNDTLCLIYAAQLASGLGGIDLYMAKIDQAGHLYEQKNLQSINSIENEVSPWFDPLSQRLYFSSTWHAGFGGFDIFYSNLEPDGSFGPPINLGHSFNSPANDLYFFCQGDTAFLSSNRLGSFYASHPTCCSDVFYTAFQRPKLPTDSTSSISIQVLELPIRLYFENDHPNPKTSSENTEFTYEETFSKYKSQFPIYLDKVAEGRDSIAAREQVAMLASFFEEEVEKGMNDLAIFKEQVWEALQSGEQVSIVVQGFASPLAKSDYNVHLTKRRIASIVNYFEEIDGGKFAPYMQTSPLRLQFIEEPMGEYKADQKVSDDLYDQKNSVYSKGASLERRIDIIALRTQKLP